MIPQKTINMFTRIVCNSLEKLRCPPDTKKANIAEWVNLRNGCCMLKESHLHEFARCKLWLIDTVLFLEKMGSLSITFIQGTLQLLPFTNTPSHLPFLNSPVFWFTETRVEKELDTSLPVRGQITSRDGKRPSIFLRYRDKEPERGFIRVYPGSLA